MVWRFSILTRKAIQHQRRRAPEDNLKLELWRKVLGFAREGISPPIEHVLAVSARTEFRSGQFRRAVIDAGTAVELSLTHVFEAEIGVLSPALRDSIIKEHRTLGKLVALLGNSLQLPEGISKELVSLRNKVIHRNYQPTRMEAKKAVDIAVDLARTARPLPQS
jgi:hypothetical protein